MSNIIKGNYIHFSQSDRVIIDSNIKTDKFNPLSFVKVEEDKTLADEALEEEAAEVEVEEIMPDLEEVNQFAESIIENAQVEAEEIIASAKANALEILEKAREQGRQEGYNSGIEELNARQEEMNQQLLQAKKELEIECEKRAKQLEPQFADLTIRLVEKLTGIVAEDKKDLILYLISTAIKPIRGPKQFYIRVSEEDSAIVTQNKEQLASLLSEDSSLEVIEDSTLSKNQCFIETEDRLLDVSLDVQLKNLSEQLSMLACT